MDCKNLLMYGLIILVALYLLKDICGFKIPFIEGMSNINESSEKEMPVEGALPSEPESFLEASFNNDILVVY